MPWGTVDDQFDEHPKVEKVLDSDHPNELMGLAALGLWQVAFTWAHRNTRRKGKTPGLIPAAIIRRWVPRGHRDDVIRELVEARLWDEHPDGWVIHDFADYLPSAKTREERSAAGRKGAAARWGNRSSHSADMAVSHEGMANSSQGDGRAMATSWQGDGKLPSPDGNLPSGDANRNGKNGSRAHPVPNTQEEPKNKDQTLFPIAPAADGGESAEPARPAKLPDGHRFDEFWSAYPHKRDKDAARKMWARLVRESQRPSGDVDLDDVIAAAGFYRHSREFVNGYPKYPGTFLNKGSWRDYVDGPPVEAPPAITGGFDARAAEFDAMRDRIRADDPAAALIQPVRHELTRGDTDA